MYKQPKNLNMLHKILLLVTFFTYLSNETLVDQCTSTPFWKLNLCQINCQTCSFNAVCIKCQQNYQLILNQCNPTTRYIQHFTIFSQPSIWLYKPPFTYQSKQLQKSFLTRLCIPSTYKFDMIGPFSQTNSLIFTLQKQGYQKQIKDIRIQFYFVSLMPNISIKLVLDNTQIFETKFPQLSKLTSKFQSYTNTSSINYMQIPALQYVSSNSIIKKVDSGYYKQQNPQTKTKHVLQIIVNTKDNTTYKEPFWMLSDFSITAKKCQNCIPQSLKSLSVNVAIAIAITAAVLILLIAVLYICIKIQNQQRMEIYEKKSKEEIKKNQNQNLHAQNLLDSFKKINDTLDSKAPKRMSKIKQK